jgi:hypothetical protein
MRRAPVRRTEDEIARVIAIYRSVGKRSYTASRVSGVARTTIKQWVEKYGEDYGAAPAQGDRVDRGIVGDGEETSTPTATVPGITESSASVLGVLVKLDTIRHRYMDRMLRGDVVDRTTAKDASLIVQSATSQIQLLTGQPTGRSETQVRYVQRGALREMARAQVLDQVAKSLPRGDTQSTG